jgi:hypothetical protein
LGWIEEGYEGHAAIKGYDDGETMKITVSPAEFKRLKKMGEGASKPERTINDIAKEQAESVGN